MSKSSKSNSPVSAPALSLPTVAIETAVAESVTQPEIVVASELQLTPAVAVAALCSPLPTVKPKRKSKPGRPYYAAQVLRANGGLNAVIDDALAEKVDLACGKPNKTESLAWLKIAQQICSGWENAAETK